MSMTATMSGSFNKLDVFQLFCRKQKWSEPIVKKIGDNVYWFTNVTGAQCNCSKYSHENLWIDAESGSVQYDSDYRKYLQPRLDKLFDPVAKSEKGAPLPSNEWNLCDVQTSLQKEGLKEGSDFEVINEASGEIRIRLFVKNKHQLAEAELGE